MAQRHAARVLSKPATVRVHRLVQVAAMLDARGAGVATTAPPRPNAYIPDDLGIPRPFGGAAPFKPSAPGATMRHHRRPAPRALVL